MHPKSSQSKVDVRDHSGTPFGGSTHLGPVHEISGPLFNQGSEKGACKAQRKTQEPEDVAYDGSGSGLEVCRRYLGRRCPSRRCSKLEGYLSQESYGRVSGIRLEILVTLDKESRQTRGIQARLK